MHTPTIDTMRLMRSVIAGCALFCAALPAKGQQKPKTPTKAPAPAAKPAAPVQPVMKSTLDSVSYAIGVLDGKFFMTQGLSKVNPALLGRGFDDVLKSKPLMTPEQADMLIRRELQRLSRAKIQPNIDEGRKFLAANAAKPGVKQTSSGLQYEVLKEGNGPKPADTSVVKIHYDGFLLNGSKFDSSRDRGEPLVYRLNGLIPGWVEGVQLMPVGSRYKLYIPYQLGYGEQGSGEKIPGGSLLVFDIELLEIVTGGQ
jgi:FKBP-type peptidyl-prolyl cis-trans isomerase